MVGVHQKAMPKCIGSQMLPHATYPTDSSRQLACVTAGSSGPVGSRALMGSNGLMGFAA